jgi:phosphatidylglycerol lysyltransferase
MAYRLTTLPHERHKAEAILMEHGHSSYDYFKVWQDKSFFFGTPESFVAYRVHRGVAVSLGDPVGPPGDMEVCIKAFADYCRDNGWLAAFLLPDETIMYRRLGLSTVKIGEEARVDLDYFVTQTANKKYFRYARRKMEGDGLRFSRHLPPHPCHLVDEIEELSGSWMGQANYREFGFVQGRLERSYLEKTRLAVLRGPDGGLQAFVNEVPSFMKGEANFDMMRRLPDTHWAAMDYLFLKLMESLREEGYRHFNMGLAPFFGVGDNTGASLVERALHVLTPYVQRFVRSEGMTQYKKKFEPSWDDRYLVYDGGPLSLPRVALAVTTVV